MTPVYNTEQCWVNLAVLTFVVAVLTTRYAMLCGRPPFETSTLKETYERIAANRYTIPNHVTPAARDLIGRLLSHYPQNRPSLSAILRHEFFTCGYMPTSLNVNCCYTAPKFPAFDAPRYVSRAASLTLANNNVAVCYYLFNLCNLLIINKRCLLVQC